MKYNCQVKHSKKNTHKVSKVIFVAVITAILILVIGRVGYHEMHYHREAIVISIDSNIVTVKDKCNYLWDFVGDGYAKGDKVKMLMHTNGTNGMIEDDTIIDVKVVSK